MAAVETGMSMLIAPLFTIGAAFGIFAIAKDEHHHVGKVTVSQTMADRGFTGEIATKALKAHMKDFYFKIDDSFASPVLPLLEDQTTEIIAEALHVDEAVLAARRLRGLVASEYELAFIEEQDGHVLYMTEIEGDDMRLTRWNFPVEGEKYDAAVAAAARQLVFEIDPTLIALTHLRNNELDAAETALEHCRHRCAYSNMASSDLLTGILALKRGHLEGARMWFKAAHLRNPRLEAATVGLAVVEVLDHHPAAAEARLRAAEVSRSVFLSRDELRRTAMLRTVRGRLLAQANQPQAAVEVLESAAETGASYYPLHIELANTYQKLNFTGAAAYHRRRAEQLRNGAYGSVDIAQVMLLDMIR
jgi:tetratricopeptide (TPR) repeat protein